MFRFLVLAVTFFTSLQSKVELGKLDNGISYVIYSLDSKSEEVSVQLVLKKGSIDEKNEELGLAHVIEHLVFHGSTSSDGSCYLSPVGISKPNGYTTFDHTCFYLNAESNPESISKSLNFLSELVSTPPLSNNVIRDEKKIVLSEYDLRVKSVEHRRLSEIYSLCAPTSCFFKRMPIGDKELIKDFDQEKVKCFFDSCYRPDSMCVIVTGNFCAIDVKEMVKETFGKLEFTNSEEREREFREADISHSSAHTAIEKENSTIDCFYLLPIRKSEIRHEAVGVYSLLAQVYLNRALEKLSMKQDSGVLGVKFGVEELDPELLLAVFHLVPYQQKVEHALYSLDRKFREALQDQESTVEGFSSSKCYVRDILEKLKASKDNPANVAADLCSNFVNGRGFKVPSEETAYLLEILEEITYEEFSQFLSEVVFPMYQKMNLLVISPDKSLVKDDQFYADYLLDLTSKPFETYENSSDKEIINPIHPILQPSEDPGEVTIEINHDLPDKMQLIEIHLSNGLKCFMLPTQIEKGEFTSMFFALGGLNAFNLEDIPSVELAPYLQRLSGTRDLPDMQFNRFLEDKWIHHNFSIAPYYRALTFKGSSDKIEDSFALFHSIFMEAKAEGKSWDHIQSHLNESTLFNENSIATFQNRLESFINFDQIVSPTSSNTDFEKTKKGLLEVLNCPQDYCCVIIGDFDPEDLYEIAEKYIASVPRGKKSIFHKERFSYRLSFPSSSIQEEVLTASDHFSFRKIYYKLDYSNILSQGHSVSALNFLVKILNERLENQLRGELAECYYTQAEIIMLNYPNIQDCLLQVTLPINCSNDKTLLDKVESIIDDLSDKVVSVEEITRARITLEEDSKKNRKSLEHWLGVTNNFLIGLSLFESEADELEALQAVTPEMILAVAKTLFLKQPSLTLTLKGEN